MVACTKALLGEDIGEIPLTSAKAILPAITLLTTRFYGPELKPCDAAYEAVLRTKLSHSMYWDFLKRQISELTAVAKQEYFPRVSESLPQKLDSEIQENDYIDVEKLTAE